MSGISSKRINAIKHRYQLPVVEVEPPTFVLRASDSIAPWVLLVWADEAEANGIDPDRIKAARRVADEMFEWQQTHADQVAVY